MPSITFQPVLRDVRDVLASEFLSIPRFQRPYSWTQENLDDFLQDVVSDNDEGYFIGPMVSHKIDKQTSAVVDGQQRLTTITIALCVLRDLFDTHGLTDFSKGVAKYIERPDDDNVAHYVLRSDAAGSYLQAQIQKPQPRELVRPKGDEQRALSKAYAEIHSTLNEHLDRFDREPRNDAELSPFVVELRRVRELLLSLQVIWIQLDSEDDAYVIFETLNSRGKDLEVVDLLKNHLLSSLPAENGDLDSARLKWSSMRAVLADEAGGANPNKFLLHWWLSQFDYTAERKLFKVMKKKIQPEDVPPILDQLWLDSQSYARIANPVEFDGWQKFETELQDALAAIELFGVRQPRPYLLALMRAYREGRVKYKTVKNSVSAIESFHFITTAVSGVSSTGGVSMMYASHAREIAAASSAPEIGLATEKMVAKLRAGLPPRDAFIANFEPTLRFSERESGNKKLVRYALQKIQADARPLAPIDWSKCNIEHLHPQSSGEKWAASIGNLLLIQSELNNALGIADYRHKIEVLSQHQSFYDVSDFDPDAEWDAFAVTERAGRLAELSYDKVWGF